MSNKDDFQIEILKREPEPKKFERDGVVRNYYSQWAELTVDGLRTSFEFSNDEPLPPGPAVIDPRSFSVTNGRLGLSRVKLLPVSPVVKPSASSPAAQAKV
ncbi:hypothetical protein FHW84_003550 [Dyella sp. SG562]|uniref:hypothetical protein n=1 Tax=Dyella sp. SG562 TaxID=2587017 RepID=UPI00142377B4|nr:hypothetical protein [Dyella sp. SG562]NII74953.1 hypothetical protein [Dyella sp. SG562]